MSPLGELNNWLCSSGVVATPANSGRPHSVKSSRPLPPPINSSPKSLLNRNSLMSNDLFTSSSSSSPSSSTSSSSSSAYTSNCFQTSSSGSLTPFITNTPDLSPTTAQLPLQQGQSIVHQHTQQHLHHHSHQQQQQPQHHNGQILQQLHQRQFEQMVPNSIPPTPSPEQWTTPSPQHSPQQHLPHHIHHHPQQTSSLSNNGQTYNAPQPSPPCSLGGRSLSSSLGHGSPPVSYAQQTSGNQQPHPLSSSVHNNVARGTNDGNSLMHQMVNASFNNFAQQCLPNPNAINNQQGHSSDTIHLQSQHVVAQQTTHESLHHQHRQQQQQQQQLLNQMMRTQNVSMVSNSSFIQPANQLNSASSQQPPQTMFGYSTQPTLLMPQSTNHSSSMLAQPNGCNGINNNAHLMYSTGAYPGASGLLQTVSAANCAEMLAGGRPVIQAAVLAGMCSGFRLVLAQNWSEPL